MADGDGSGAWHTEHGPSLMVPPRGKASAQLRRGKLTWSAPVCFRAIEIGRGALPGYRRRQASDKSGLCVLVGAVVIDSRIRKACVACSGGATPSEMSRSKDQLNCIWARAGARGRLSCLQDVEYWGASSELAAKSFAVQSPASAIAPGSTAQTARSASFIIVVACNSRCVATALLVGRANRYRARSAVCTIPYVLRESLLSRIQYSSNIIDSSSSY